MVWVKNMVKNKKNSYNKFKYKERNRERIKREESREEAKETIGWCKECNLPILGSRCEICNNIPSEIKLSPPGDVRFASRKGKRLLAELFSREFGVSSFLDGKIVLFNKIPGQDRTDEIIIDGNVIGVLFFDLEEMDYRLDLREGGIPYLVDAKRRIVECNERIASQGHIKGRGIKKKDIVLFGDGIKRNDDVIIKFGTWLGFGRARYSTSDFSEISEISDEEIVLRVRGICGIDDKRIDEIKRRKMKKRTIHECVRANIGYLKGIEEKAVNEIKDAFVKNANKDKNKKQFTVSFSGGKDSLVACEIAKRAIGDSGDKKELHLVYIDTGLEFPETKKFVEDYANKEGLCLKVARANDAFEKNLYKFGIPSKDLRWCCKVCKLAPVSELFAKEYPNGCISIDGKRKRESFVRAKIGKFENNPFVPNQISYYPIREWRAIEVWLYITYRGLDYNPLYDEDYERIGCYMCPAELGSEFENVKNTHPELYRKWMDILLDFAKKASVSEGYVTHGFWRWRRQPPKMRELADRLSIDISKTLSSAKQERGKFIEINNLGRYCEASNNWLIEGKFECEGLAFERVVEFLKTVGYVRYSEDLGVAIVDMNGIRAKIFANGDISVTSERKLARKELEEIAKAILKGEMCTLCGICVNACVKNAIKIAQDKGEIQIDEGKCSRCGKCDEGCVVLKYHSNLAKIEI